MHEIVLDTVIYGNSIVNTLSGGPQRLQRIDLADALIQIGASTIQSITTSQGSTLDDDYIHFTHNRGSGGPLGISAFGSWFHNFYLIRDAPEALANASIMRNLGIDQYGLSSVSQIRDYFAEAILTGADLVGYQYSMISDVSQTLPTTIGILLRADLDARRAEIRERVERDIFPLALGRTWQPRDWPEFEMLGL